MSLPTFPHRAHLLLPFALLLYSCTSQTPYSANYRVNQLTATELVKFENDREFTSWMREVRREALRQDLWWAGKPIRRQSSWNDGNQELQEITITGSRISASSITNNQMLGVDEGDIVKQSGRFLLILADGRLFSVDTGNDGDSLQLADRIDVYRSAGADTWYDEMLIQGDRLVVTGYSYAEDATELSLFTLDATGKLVRGNVYYLSSNDYYSSENYASRLVGDKLVFYTPIHLTDIDPRKESVSWPLIRRWTGDVEHQASVGTKTRVFDAHQVYYPIQPTLQPVMHSVSICDLASATDGGELECTATAIVGTSRHEYLVTETDAWLWLWGDTDELGYWGEEEQAQATCTAAPAFADGAPSTLFRLPLSGAKPQAVHVRGRPDDQFGLDSSAAEFRALLAWGAYGCGENNPQLALRYFSIPVDDLRDRPFAADEARFIKMPALATSGYETRFTDSHLVYASHSDDNSFPPEPGAQPNQSTVVTVPLASPTTPAVIAAPHDVMRVERAGQHVVLTGYQNDAGLSVSLLDTNSSPRIVATQQLSSRFESEARSHAFNSTVFENGGLLMGIPTTLAEKEAGRFWWESEDSDISFLRAPAGGGLESLGALRVRPDSVAGDYRCVVSCVDWYGNARPFFIDGRIYALTGAELIEGQLVGDEIRELRRINITAALQ